MIVKKQKKTAPKESGFTDHPLAGECGGVDSASRQRGGAVSDPAAVVMDLVFVTVKCARLCNGGHATPAMASEVANHCLGLCFLPSFLCGHPPPGHGCALDDNVTKGTLFQPGGVVAGRRHHVVCDLGDLGERLACCLSY